MQRIILDTNVLVSALIQRNIPYLIINELFIEDKISICLSDELLAEYYEVLNRKKFAKYPDFVKAAATLLATIETKAIKFYPNTKVTLISDQDDNRLLELAEESKANYLITGNFNDFTMDKSSTRKPKLYRQKNIGKAISRNRKSTSPNIVHKPCFGRRPRTLFTRVR